VKDITNKIVTNNLQTTILQHELPEADLTQGRDTPDKSFIFKSVSLYIYICTYIYICLNFIFSLLNSYYSEIFINFVTDKSIIGPFEPQARKPWFGYRDS